MSTTQADTGQVAREDTAGHSEEWIQGAETAAWRTAELAGRGHSADQVAQSHEDHHGDRADGDWDAGYRETAAHDMQELREMADLEAEERQAARDEADATGGGPPGGERDRNAEAERDEPEAGS